MAARDQDFTPEHWRGLLTFPGATGLRRGKAQRIHVRRVKVRALSLEQVKTLLTRARLLQIRLHDLRHTAATLLLRANVNPKVVSEMLGHASSAITLDIYSHVLPDMQRDTTAAMERMLWAEG